MLNVPQCFSFPDIKYFRSFREVYLNEHKKILRKQSVEMISVGIIWKGANWIESAHQYFLHKRSTSLDGSRCDSLLFCNHFSMFIRVWSLFYLFIYLFIYLFVYLFIYLCIYLFIIFIEGREGRQNFKILFCF